MLHFYGIEYRGGEARRFAFRIELLRHFAEVLTLLQKADHDLNATIQKLDSQLETIFSSHSKSNKKNIQAIFIKKNIIEFLLQNSEHKELLLRVISILISKTSIELKWEYLQEVLSINRAVLELDDLNLSFANEHSLLNKILVIIRLAFLEQIAELPPANVKLVMIPHKFPSHNWISSELGSYIQSVAWNPKEIHCSLVFLQNTLWQKMSNLVQTNSLKITPRQQANSVASFASLNQEYDSWGVTLVVEDEAKKAKTLQMELFNERPWESLQGFQQHIFKKYQMNGQLLLFAILHQLGIHSSDRGRLAIFDLDYHFRLLGANTNSKKDNTWNKTELIFKELEAIKVIRKQSATGAKFTNKLIFVWGWKESTKNYPQNLMLVLDDLFYNHNNSQISLGAAFSVLPAVLFKTKIPVALKDSYRVLVYLCTRWLSEFSDNQGVITENVRGLIDGCNLVVTKSGRYRIVYKILAMMRFMKEHKMIADYAVKDSSAKDMWKTVYVIRATAESIKAMQNYHNASLSAETRLINN